MKSIPVNLVVLLMVSLGSLSVAAVTDPDRPNLLAMSEEEAVLLPLMHQRIRSVMLEGQAEQAAIEADRSATRDPDELRVLDKRLARAREATEMAIYGIQAEFARLEGRKEDAAHFEQLVEAMKKPAVMVDVQTVAPRVEVSR